MCIKTKIERSCDGNVTGKFSRVVITKTVFTDQLLARNQLVLFRVKLTIINLLIINNDLF